MIIKTYVIPAFYAPYLMYGETDGLTVGEIKIFHRFVQTEELKGGHWSIPTDEISFTACHDLRPYILAADCMEVDYVIIGG